MGTPVCTTAPWEQVDTPERAFEVCASQTLSKSTKVRTQDYRTDSDGEDEDLDTSDTDWKSAFLLDHMTPLNIIEASQKIAKELLSKGQKRVAGIPLKSLVDSCKDWVCDEFEVVEN